MDKIWYRNPSKSEVICHVAGMKKPNDHAEQNRQKSNANKIYIVWTVDLYS